MLNKRLLFPGLSPLLLMPLFLPQVTDAAPAFGGPVIYSQTFVGNFGPELGDWQQQQISLPKFNSPRNSTLIEVQVELCGQSIADAQYQNNDDDPCILSYHVTADVIMSAADPAAPINPFALNISASGGPVPLEPGESGFSTTDSGIICNPVQSYTEKVNLQFFRAALGDESLVFNHSGLTNAIQIGCGVIDFSTTVFSTLSVQVTYLFVLPENLPPMCRFACDLLQYCQGGITIIFLDARRSEDPEGELLTYLWTTDCDEATIADPTGRTTLITIDTGSGPCQFTCNVTLTVSDGPNSVSCTDTIDL